MAGRILPTGFSEGSQIEIGRYRTHEEHIVSCMFGREKEGMRNRRIRKFSFASTNSVYSASESSSETSGTYTTQIDLSQGDTYSIILNAGPRSVIPVLKLYASNGKEEAFKVVLN